MSLALHPLVCFVSDRCSAKHPDGYKPAVVIRRGLRNLASSHTTPDPSSVGLSDQPVLSSPDDAGEFVTDASSQVSTPKSFRMSGGLGEDGRESSATPATPPTPLTVDAEDDASPAGRGAEVDEVVDLITPCKPSKPRSPPSRHVRGNGEVPSRLKRNGKLPTPSMGRLFIERAEVANDFADSSSTSLERSKKKKSAARSKQTQESIRSSPSPRSPRSPKTSSHAALASYILKKGLPMHLLPNADNPKSEGDAANIKAGNMQDSDFSLILSACARRSQRALARPFVAARRKKQIGADCSIVSFYRDDKERSQFFDEHVIKKLFPRHV